MIAYLKGRILSVESGNVLVAVGDPSGASCVGYQVHTPSHPTYLDLKPEADAEFFIYTHVREDAFDLFGFLTMDEKELFLSLLSVNGIGPKNALGIISHTDAQSLVRAIHEQDKDYLVRLPGVGKKTADRLLLELKDILKKKIESGKITVQKKFSQTGAGAVATDYTVPSDVKLALTSLGYRDIEMKKAFEYMKDEMQPNMKTEELIKLALRWLAR